MENKQQPSNLLFVPSHHHFGMGGIPFTEEMLEWPFYGDRGELTGAEYDEMVTSHRNAFQGVVALPGLAMEMSLEVNLHEKRFSFPKRVWGIIHITEKETLQFSHDSRHNNYPFNSLCHWPEWHEIPMSNAKWDEIWKRLSELSVEDWEQFFRSRIMKKSDELVDKAENKRKDAKELDIRSRTILKTLV